ncbi:uncharacterized protein FIESC28_07429 [Fusarium coffeatum]|uniref:Gamma-glutamylcyclotransferase AIG2-like domain-containing protein n=1 Tax=Fusarium coffeatum TaxID=231269 RepID=A0A366RDA0_9HYPO|nr:uncharacterized protein FIESC28_07429 [Fusarium coffeatum]RBR15113.1 hypothetical protein FIESC28_07429 [Fusarium coffeatum]
MSDPPPPPPPPLPPLKPSQHSHRIDPPPTPKPPPKHNPDSLPFIPTTYPFYGTLTHPSILAHILCLPSQPTLHQASLTGYALTSWGQYRALVPGSSSSVVSGFTYEVQTQGHELALARYETHAYEAVPCLIRLVNADGKVTAEVSGKTFVYAGDPRALEQGTFDRKLWEY